jgi:hypothetical protein
VTTNLPLFNQEHFASSFSEQNLPASDLLEVHENGSICKNSGILTENFDIDFNLDLSNGNYTSIPSIPSTPSPSDNQPTWHIAQRPLHGCHPLSYPNDTLFRLGLEEQSVLNAINIPNGWEVAAIRDLESVQQLPELESSWSPDRCHEAIQGLSSAYTTLPLTA